MPRTLAAVSLLVHDYEEALDFFIRCCGFSSARTRRWGAANAGWWSHPMRMGRDLIQPT
jgi:hypothetical protein